MLYKNVKYSCNQVEKYGGKIVTVYSCGDKDLLKEYTTTYFEAFTKHRMHEKIDHYLDNAQEQKARRELNMKAAQEFYASMGENKGD
jgi:hypothetical protein